MFGISRGVHRRVLPVGVVLAIAVVGAIPSSVRAARDVSPATFSKVSSGIALIHTYRCNGKPIGQGTGFLVGDSVVMTARHVVVGACRVLVRVNGGSFEGTRWVFWYGTGTSPSGADLATIKLNRVATDAFVFRVRSSLPPLGSNLGMVGYPLGNRLSLNQGKIIWRGKSHGAPLLAVRMLGAEGASGSPFIDDQGRVVGILQVGLGSKDVLGQRTSGVLEGLDLVRWWGPRARLDLCHAYPNGGIGGCPNSTPPPPPPPPATSVTVTSAYLTATNTGNDSHQTSFPSAAGFIAYLQMTFASPVQGTHTSDTYSVDPSGAQTQQCSGSLGVGWTGATCLINLGDYPTPGSWKVVYSIDGQQAGALPFQVTGSAPPPSPTPHIQQCWAQYDGGSTTTWNPASATTAFSGSDILARGATNFSEIASLDRTPLTDIVGATLSLIEPNGQVFYTATVSDWKAGYTFYGFDFHWTWDDGSLFFQHPELSGQGTWTFKWTGPDGQVCSNTITVS